MDKKLEKQRMEYEKEMKALSKLSENPFREFLRTRKKEKESLFLSREPIVFEDCRSLIWYEEWQVHIIVDREEQLWECDDTLVKNIKVTGFTDPCCLGPLMYWFAENDRNVENGNELNEEFLNSDIGKGPATDRRNKRAELLLKRIRTVLDDGKNLNEDHLLKTLWAVCRHYYEYEETGFLTKEEVRIIYELEMIVLHHKLESAENYGGGAKMMMYMLIFDVLMGIARDFPEYYGEFTVFLGFGLYIPGGCSNLYTDAVSYEEFRDGIQNLDYWTDIYNASMDEKDQVLDERYPKSGLLFPQHEIDENDKEIFELFGDDFVPEKIMWYEL